MITDEYYISLMREIEVCRATLDDIGKKLSRLDPSSDNEQIAELLLSRDKWTEHLRQYEEQFQRLK
ncbi:MAG: hypothetical protein LLF86_03640 [Nitrospiraceae bacterium]|nr:hypothetical protein [Nitrospiraceae bacterium]